MKTTIIASAALLTAFVAHAQEIEIKGIRMGMTKSEVAKTFPKGMNSITIGGQHQLPGSPRVTWKDGKLYDLGMLFPIDAFDKLKLAATSKFKLECNYLSSGPACYSDLLIVAQDLQGGYSVLGMHSLQAAHDADKSVKKDKQDI
jgi:hypothetical protein